MKLLLKGENTILEVFAEDATDGQQSLRTQLVAMQKAVDDF